MRILLKRFKIIFFINIIAVSLLATFFVYFPMSKMLENSLIDNFIQISHSNLHVIESTIERFIEGTSGISSRTVIKDAISKYKEGTMSFETLQTFTQPKFEEGVRSLKNVISAYRYVDGKIISSVNLYENNTKKAMLTKLDFSDQIDTMLIHEEMVPYLWVITPIVIGDSVLGHDVICYSLGEVRAQLENTIDHYFIAFEIVDAKVIATLENSQYYGRIHNAIISRTKDEVFVYSHLMDDQYYFAHVEEAVLFAPINNLTQYVVKIWGFAFAFSYLIIYIFVVRYAQKSMKKLEVSKDAFQNLANFDDLTKAYNRTYFEYWKEKLIRRNKKHTLVMIDIDDFKRINDSHGHLMGDRVIQMVSNSIKNVIRQSDLLFRYGGDEFLIILEETTEVDTALIMNRIVLQLGNQNEYPFRIMISYGVGTLMPGDNFNFALMTADEKMYQDKKLKKGEHDFSFEQS